jgi:hypothetical protein
MRLWRVGEIIEKGLNAIGETVDHLNGVDKLDRDVQYAKALTCCVLAAVEIDKNSRDAAKWLKEQKLGSEELRTMLANHLREMPKEDFIQLMQQVGAAEKQAS